MPGASEYLQEVTSRVFGDFIQEGFLVVVADDMFIGGNSIEELIANWLRILQRLRENNLTLSPKKTYLSTTDNHSRLGLEGWYTLT